MDATLRPPNIFSEVAVQLFLPRRHEIAPQNLSILVSVSSWAIASLTKCGGAWTTVVFVGTVLYL